MFERNEYEKAMELFHQAVNESRDVQSLNNLAWMYLYEEEDYAKSLELILEAVDMKPNHYFPYNILGETYIKLERWKEAKEALEKAISFQAAKETYENLAGVNIQLGELEEAAAHYLKAAGDSDLPMYCHIKCLIDLSCRAEAKEKLDQFNEDADNFIGEIEIAELYGELGEFEKAIEWFEKGYGGYAKTRDWIGTFVYALYKTNNLVRIQEVIDEAIQSTNEDIENTLQEEVDEHWTEDDQKEYIEKCKEDKKYYEQLLEKIAAGFVPPIKFEPYFTGTCYLFGCKQHGHPEYQE